MSKIRNPRRRAVLASGRRTSLTLHYASNTRENTALCGATRGHYAERPQDTTCAACKSAKIASAMSHVTPEQVGAAPRDLPPVAQQLAEWSAGFLNSRLEYAECTLANSAAVDEAFSDSVGMRPQDDPDLRNPTDAQWDDAWDEAKRLIVEGYFAEPGVR